MKNLILAACLGAALFSAFRWAEAAVQIGLFERQTTIAAEAVRCAVKTLDGIQCETDTDCVDQHRKLTVRCMDGEL